MINFGRSVPVRSSGTYSSSAGGTAFRFLDEEANRSAVEASRYAVRFFWTDLHCGRRYPPPPARQIFFGLTCIVIGAIYPPPPLVRFFSTDLYLISAPVGLPLFLEIKHWEGGNLRMHH
jgi:hypothetical protein